MVNLSVRFFGLAGFFGVGGFFFGGGGAFFIKQSLNKGVVYGIFFKYVHQKRPF